MTTINDYSLYLVTGEECSAGRTTLEVVKAAIEGGIDVIQLREKNKPYDELLTLGKEIASLCKDSGVLFIVNDDPTLAKDVDADGVHLGQDDCDVKSARNIIGKNKIIGLSTHSLEQVKEANKLDVDYIGYGPVFPTKTKDYFIGTDDVSSVMEVSEIPVVFIGGINTENLSKIQSLGGKNVAFIRGIVEADDIALRVKELKRMIKNEN